jgi:arsenate reductase (thioredoxin)
MAEGSSSTSFANPAVTIARMFSDTFTGIEPSSVCRCSSSPRSSAAPSATAWPTPFTTGRPLVQSLRRIDMNSALPQTALPAPEPASQPARRGVTDYDRLVDDLAYTYEGIFSRDFIGKAVAEARAALEPTATIKDFLPILVSRFAREQLTAAAQADGRLIKPVPELLFICVQNAGRSQMAAALAQHLSAGKVHVRSAGSKSADKINPTAVQVLAERGIILTEAYPKPLTNEVVHAADVIVTMGCGDACPIYPGKRYLDWNVADPNDQPIERVRDIRDDLQARITALLRDLNI